jgi:prepilin-type N-terminal cleavage/methylation domain-containing protein
MPRVRAPRGITLVELLVVLAIMAIAATLVALEPPRARHSTAGDLVNQQIAAARRAALDSGHAVTVAPRDSNEPLRATAFPDGSVVADPRAHIDRFSGAPDSVGPNERMGHAQ